MAKRINPAKEFEDLTKKIVDEIKRISSNYENAVIKAGVRNRIEGASGFKHQIDVSIEINNDNCKKLLLIECKHYAAKVALNDMLILIARIDDIKRNRKIDVRGIFFTTKGYTWPAKKIGESYKIDLNTAKDIKSFAVTINKNLYIKAEPFVINGEISGTWHSGDNQQ